jgi:uncharacterized protein YkwD
MRRSFLTAILPALAVLLLAPAGAQARTACGAEQSAPTSANSTQISDAIFCMTNQVRASYGLPAFRRDARLDAAARLHSADMATRDYFAHVTPEGLTPTDRAAAQGYTVGVGENIAYGYPSAAAAMIGWMASDGHCRNILGSAQDIGIGTSGAGTPYYTMALGDYGFGTSSPARDGCPYDLNLETLAGPAQPASPFGATPTTVTPPVADTPAIAQPSLSGLSLSRARLRAGGRGSIVYTLAAPATVTFRVERVHAGRRAGGRCVAASAANRAAAPCSRYRPLAGSLTDAGEAGANAFAFRGRLRGRPLAAGRYRVRAVARDEDGSASQERFARFIVVR